MNGKEGNYLQRKTYNVEIIYIPIFELFIYIFFIFYLGLLRKRQGEMQPKHLTTDARTLKLHLVNLKSILSRYYLKIFIYSFIFFHVRI